MAEYTSRLVTTSRMEYTLPSGTTWGEVEKVLAAIQQRTKGIPEACYDDFVTVEARDDEIVFSFPMQTGEDDG